LRIIEILASSLRFLFAVLLCLAFLPRFYGSPSPRFPKSVPDEECEPLLARFEEDDLEAPISGEFDQKPEGPEGIVNGGANQEQALSHSDPKANEEPEEEEPKMVHAYDIFAVLRRIYRLLPYVVPLRSRLVQATACEMQHMQRKAQTDFPSWSGVCIGLTLFGNVSVVLVPRQLGYTVNDLSEGRSPYQK
jgi:hypothetical protein